MKLRTYLIVVSLFLVFSLCAGIFVWVTYHVLKQKETVPTEIMLPEVRDHEDKGANVGYTALNVS